MKTVIQEHQNKPSQLTVSYLDEQSSHAVTTELPGSTKLCLIVSWLIHVDLNPIDPYGNMRYVCACVLQYGDTRTRLGSALRTVPTVQLRLSLRYVAHTFVIVGSFSHLNGLKVNRLLLTIILPSVRPIIISQNERPLTFLLTSRRGSWSVQTFHSRPVQQRFHGSRQLVFLREHDSHGCSFITPGEITQSFTHQVPFSVSFGVLFRRQRNTLNMRWSRCMLSQIQN